MESFLASATMHHTCNCMTDRLRVGQDYDKAEDIGLSTQSDYGDVGFDDGDFM